MSNLVIVESPAKAKTIMKYLGKDYKVVASMGHVRDLPKSVLGVDVENNFQPKYINIKGKEKLILNLKELASKSNNVYLATDPDREGEAISWHLAYILGLDLDKENRVTFNEITKNAVKEGMNSPRRINMNLVDAQQARRVLDRIVGYKISPFLWKKIKSGLSAGRVQSVAVRLIVDREEEIRAFVPEEYWRIEAKLATSSRAQFTARFYGDKNGEIKITNQQQSEEIVDKVRDREFVVSQLKKAVKRRNPTPPFITSTLQQEASRKLGFQARRTMKVAQELYEGVEIDQMGATGLITYMRTDSLRVSNEALSQARDYIKKTYGDSYLPASPNIYKSKRQAQDGHEAIRPTMPFLEPNQIKKNLTSDQYKLYKLIWERFIASQMNPAVLDTLSADIQAGYYLFKASGFTVRFDGFTILYTEDKDEKNEKNTKLPEIEEGDKLKLKQLTPSQHFTQPPHRYTEASLIKALEENGIGRPSTYAPIITTILQRNYVEREDKSFKPTPLGEITTRLMKEQFAGIVDISFTASMEQQLDEIEQGEKEWQKILGSFYSDLIKMLEQAEKNMDGTRLKVPDEVTDQICELCGRNMVIKTGRFGKFLACPGFPECKNTKKIMQETDGICPQCGSKIYVKTSKKGRVFYGCENNPKCSFMTWDEPSALLCEVCNSTLLIKKGRNPRYYCSKEGCNYQRPYEK